MKKQFWILGLAVLLLLTGCGKTSTPEAPIEEENGWQEAYDSGLEYYEEGSFSKAARELENAIHIDPTRAEAYLALAEIYEAQDDPEAAIDCLHDALEYAEETDDVQDALIAIHTKQQETPPQEEVSVSAPAAPEPEVPQEPAEEPEPPAEAPAEPQQPVLLTPEEIEAEVLRIREVCNEIGGNLEALLSEAPDGYTTLWRQDGQLLCIMIAAGGHNSDLGRTYYFENGQLLFAYLEGTDSYRLYFHDGALFRMRYTPDKNAPDAAVNYDQTMTDEYLYWQSFAFSDCERTFQTIAAGS